MKTKALPIVLTVVSPVPGRALGRHIQQVLTEDEQKNHEQDTRYTAGAQRTTTVATVVISCYHILLPNQWL